MVLTVVSNYKTEKNPYINGFVHSRVLSYKENNIDATVFVINEKKVKEKYVFEGVEVNVGNINDFISFINEHSIESICIHFLDSSIIKALEKISNNINIFIFVHGVEALYWYERLFPYMFSDCIAILKFCKYIFYNIIDMHNIRKFIKYTKHNITLITVSEWMKSKANKNWKCNRDWFIIPNIINNKLFTFYEKDTSQRYKLLSIRPFTSGKYGNDITVKLIKKLSHYQEFNKMDFLIIGDGRLFNKFKKQLSCYNNVVFSRKFLQQREISYYHKQFGIFICPTRQDAQGVSMCEAMSSGLLPITSNNTAIPEYIPIDSGLACNSIDEMVNKILMLVNDEKYFLKLSKEVSEFIQNKCSYEKTVKLELELITRIKCL